MLASRVYSTAWVYFICMIKKKIRFYVESIKKNIIMTSWKPIYFAKFITISI